MKSKAAAIIAQQQQILQQQIVDLCDEHDLEASSFRFAANSVNFLVQEKDLSTRLKLGGQRRIAVLITEDGTLPLAENPQTLCVENFSSFTLEGYLLIYKDHPLYQERLKQPVITIPQPPRPAAGTFLDGYIFTQPAGGDHLYGEAARRAREAYEQAHEAARRAQYRNVIRGRVDMTRQSGPLEPQDQPPPPPETVQSHDGMWQYMWKPRTGTWEWQGEATAPDEGEDE